MHGRKDEGKIVMAMESTDEHGKIKPIIVLGVGCSGHSFTGTHWDT
jgi:hypothetical protein